MVLLLAARRFFIFLLVVAKYSLKLSASENGERVPLSNPRRVRFALDELGGVFFKLGQILAMRFDLISERYAVELMNLFDNARALPDATLFRVFSRETHFEMEDEFVLEPGPVAVASFAQVYKGTYKGSTVAIKIQKPHAKRHAKADILLVRFFGRLAHFFGILRAISIDEVTPQLKSWLDEELDYRREANNAMPLRAHVERHGEEKIIIPAVFEEFTTERVLVTEYLSGTPVSAVIKKRDLAQVFSVEERRAAAEFLVRDLMRQYFIDGFFHADPHPGNLMLYKDGSIGYLDFGIIGKPKTSTANFLTFIEGVSLLDFTKMIDGFMSYGRQHVETEMPTLVKEDRKLRRLLTKGFDVIGKKLEADFIPVINEWHALTGNQDAPLESRSSAGTFFRMMKCGERYGIIVPPDVIGFVRSLMIVDMVCLRLESGFNMVKAVQKFFDVYPRERVESMRQEHGAGLPLAEVDVLDLRPDDEPRISPSRARERELYKKERLVARMLAVAERNPELYTMLKG